MLATLTSPLALTAAAGIASQIARPLITLLTLPALLHALGVEGLGVWMIALAVMGMIGFANAGLSSAVVTAIGRASAGDEPSHVDRMVTAATAIALIWGIVTASVCLPLAVLIDWHALLRLTPRGPSPAEVSALMGVLASSLAVGFLAVVPKHVMMGRQQGYLAHALDLAGVVAGSLALLIALNLRQPLPLLAAAFLLPQQVVLFVGGAIYLRRAGIPLFAPSRFDGRVFTLVACEGAKLSLYQASFAISSQSDLLLIAIVLGASDSAGYGIAQRVFALPVMLAASVNYALWPALAKADAAGRGDWVARTFRRTLLATVGGATAAGLLLAAVYDPLVGLWLGQAVTGDRLVIAGMVCWTMVSTFVMASDTVLRARNATGFITRCMVAMMVVNLVASVLLLQLIGPAGAIFGSVIGFATCLLVPYAMRLRAVLAGRGVAVEAPAAAPALAEKTT